MSDTSESTIKTVKRRKVSRACVNCRRRKIKCTGTNPCTNCSAYKCPCVYIDKPKRVHNKKTNIANNLTLSPTASVSDNDKNNNDDNSSIEKTELEQNSQNIHENKTSVSSLLSNDVEGKVTLSQFNTQSSQLYNVSSTLVSLPLQTEDTTSNSILKSTLNSSSQSQKIQNTSETVGESQNKISNSLSFARNKNDNKNNNSSMVTKRRKYKKQNKASNINEPLFEDNGLYSNDLESQPEYISLVEAINQMESINNPNDVLKDVIKETKEKLNIFIRTWTPSIDFNKLNQFKDSKSIETKLMKNKYRNIIYLGGFASLNTLGSSNTKVVPSKKMKNDLSISNNKANKGNKNIGEQSTDPENANHVTTSQQQSFLQQLPLIDELFGLYSPMDALSLRGVGSLVQRYATVKNKDIQAKMKATVYILLRFFDMCCVHLKESVISVANPLGDYLERNCGDSYVSTTNYSNKDLVQMIISKFPQPFTKEITAVSNEDLLKLLEHDLDMFRTVLKMYKLHRIEMEKMAMKFAHKNCHLDMSKMGELLDQFVNFFKLQDLLVTLCYSCYNTTLYHLDEYNQLDYIELLLMFLDNQPQLDQDYGYEKILAVALDCAHKIGLHRWEYYVNLDENLAERRRVAWWKLYEHEKLFSTKRGFMSGINDDKVNCLLPEPMRIVGFVDHADFLSRILKYEPDMEIFKNMSVHDLKSYGKCAMSQILSDLYVNVMFSDKYTSIKNVALPQSIREEYLDEVHDYCELTKKRLERVKEHTKRLFEIARRPRVDMNSAVPHDEKFEVSEYVMLYSLYYTLNIKACCSLTSRLMHQPKTSKTKNMLLQYHREIHEIFNKTSKFLLEMETCYEMWKLFEFYCFTSIVACFSMSDNYNFTTEDDLINVLKIFNSVLAFSEGFEELRVINKNIIQSWTVKGYGRSFSMMAILIRILLLHYMVKNNVNVKNLKERLENILKSRNESSDVVGLIDVFMDHDSYAFNFILAPVQESGFHLNVQQIMEGTYSRSADITNRRKSSKKVVDNKLGTDDQNEQESTTVAINVYPAFVLNESERNKISMRSSPTTLKVFNNNNTNNNETPFSMKRSLLQRDENEISPSLQSRGQITQDTYNNNKNNNNKSDRSNDNYPLMSSSIVNQTTNQNDMIFPRVQQGLLGQVPENSSNSNSIVANDNPVMVVQPSINNSAYNLGTLEEFVNNTDLNDLYKWLWNDNSIDFF